MTQRFSSSLSAPIMAPSSATSPNVEHNKVEKAALNKSRATSCERCKRRKQRCDHRLPTCTNCLKAGAKCVQPEKYGQLVPLKDDYTILLEEKVAKLEADLKKSRDNNYPNSKQSVAYDQRLYNENGGAGPATATTNGSNSSPGSVNTPGSEHSNNQQQQQTNGNGNSNNNTGTNHATVSILNSDPESGVAAPQSFSVVSSLLQDNFWGRTSKNASTKSHMQPHIHPTSSDTGERTANNLNDDNDDYGDNKNNNSSNLLPDYNFDEYLKSRPIDIPDESTGRTLLDNYLKIQGKFSFMDKNNFIKLHQDRHKCPNNLDDPNYRFNSFVLFSIYALSTVLQPPSFVAGKSFLEPHRYYSTALRHARLCKSNNPIWKIKALLICAMYQMRTDVDHGCHFDMVNRCIKLCAEVGLHKSKGFEKLSLYEQEMRKRLFWSVYGLERLYAISTGRRFGLEEEEISLDFPLDLDFDDLTEDNIREARNSKHETPEVTATTFTKHTWKLRRLESDMVTAIYRTDRPMQELFSKVDYYLAALKDWREVHKPFTTREENVASIAYAKGVRLLLQPFLASLDPDGPLFKKCVVETGRICGVFRDFYRKAEEGYTTIAMHTNFIAGLTLIYCLWLSKDTNFLPILESIRICTTSLYMLTERSKLCKNYRDTFENLVTATIKHVIANQSSRLQANNENQSSIRPPMFNNESTSIFQNIVSSRQPQIQEPPEEEEEERNVQHQPQQQHQEQPQQQPVATTIPPTAEGYPTIENNNQVDMRQNLDMAPNNDPLHHHTVTSSGDPSSQPIVANTSWAYGAQPQVSLPSSNPAPSHDWLDACGYDDTMYNMIQDISSWTKVSGESNFDTQIPDNIWTNLTDFSLT